MFEHGRDRTPSVAAFSDHFDLRIALQEIAQSLPREWLIFDYHGPNFHRAFEDNYEALTAGMTTVATTPSGFPGSSVKRWSSP